MRLTDIVAAGSYAQPYVSVHITTQKAPQAKSLNTEVSQRIGENRAITSYLGETRNHLDIHVASTRCREDSFGKLLEGQQPGVISRRAALRDHV